MRPVLAALLLLGAPARGDDLAARAARACPLVPRAPALAVGESGDVTVAIACESGVHVQRQAPLRVAASASPGLALERARLGWDDVRGTRDTPEVRVPVTAAAPGAAEVRLRLQYFACSEEWCVRQERELVVPVAVREAPAGPSPRGDPSASAPTSG